MNYNTLYALLLASGLGGFAPLVMADDTQDVGSVNVAGKQTLGTCLLVARRPIDLPRQKEPLNLEEFKSRI